MGPRIREDNGGVGAVLEPPLRRRWVARLDVTGDGEGRPYGGKGTERHDVGGGGWFVNRRYGGQAQRGKNGRSGNDVVAYEEWGRATTRDAATGEREMEGPAR